jgi:iron complex outermembrane recepter protein
LNVRYSPIWMDGLAIDASAVNLFDQNPPYAFGSGVTTGIHYDVGNASPLGRLLSLQIKKQW